MDSNGVIMRTYQQYLYEKKSSNEIEAFFEFLDFKISVMNETNAIESKGKYNRIKLNHIDKLRLYYKFQDLINEYISKHSEQKGKQQ